MSNKRIEELHEIASRICELDPEDRHMESAVWMEGRGCRSMLEIYLVRNEVLGLLVYGRGGLHE